MHVANITIDNTKVAADLTDFVVYVDLSDMNADFWNTVANGGGDIRVYKSDGTTELAREVVSCDTSTKTGELHFKYTGTLSSTVDTEVQIHADGTSSDYAVTDTYGRNAVWSDYDMVWHMEGNTNDSTVNAYNGSGSTIDFSDANGKIEQGGDYAGDKTTTTLSVDNIAGVSVTFWINFDSLSATTQRTFAQRDGGGKGWASVFFDVTNTASIFYVGNSSSVHVTPDAGALSTATWYKVTATYDGSNVRLYLNTTLKATESLTGNTYSCGYPVQIGCKTAIGGSDSLHFNGKIDEIKVKKGTSVFSTDWITTEYNNQNSPSTFYTVTDVSSANTSNMFLMF